jgi:hypothetical protein
VAYEGTVTGTPFDEVKGLKGPVVITGILAIPTSTLDAGCYTNVTGTFALAVPRGNKGKVAIELIASGSFCLGSFLGTFEIDSSNSQVAAFRDSTGNGVMQLQSAVDVSTPDDSSPVAIDIDGIIELRR